MPPRAAPPAVPPAVPPAAPAARRALMLALVSGAAGAAMVLLALPPVLQATHVAVGAGVWAGLVLVAL